MSWAAFIGGSVGIWTKKAIASLGMGVIAFVGFTAARDIIDDGIQSMLSGIPADAYQIIALAGFIDALGVWLGALTAAATFHAFGKIGMLGGGGA